MNYSGSTGYGRAYRERLYRRWGDIDVADCVAAAKHLADIDRVDSSRMAIRGGSAGGYVALLALANYDVFSAGGIYYGVTDALAFTKVTHKFESGYDEWLLGELEGNEELYRERSPISHLEKYAHPMIFFQGLDDKVVPPSQTERMVEALNERGLPYAYLMFDGEGHGFKKAESIKRSLEAELNFYRRIFGIPTDIGSEPVNIMNFEEDTP